MGKRYKAEEIVMKLREIEFSVNKGMPVVRQGFQTKVIIAGGRNMAA